MGKTTKTLLITATSLVIIGCVIFIGVMTVLKWDFTKLQTIKSETNSHIINENYRNIQILTNTADIVFKPSENEKTSVVCYERQNVKHLVFVEDETLQIKRVDNRKWYEYLGISLSIPEITVYLPRGEYGSLLIKSSTGDVVIPKEFEFESADISQSTGDITVKAYINGDAKLKTTTGDISLKNTSVGTLNLTASTGDITVFDVNCSHDANIKLSTGDADLNNLKCESLTASGSTGDIFLKNVIAKDKFTIKRSTGDIKFDSSDATEIFVKTSTGDIKGTLLTEKIFIVQTDVGKVNVPKTANGGKCEITTDTGDVKITIKN